MLLQAVQGMSLHNDTPVAGSAVVGCLRSQISLLLALT